MRSRISSATRQRTANYKGSWPNTRGHCPSQSRFETNALKISFVFHHGSRIGSCQPAQPMCVSPSSLLSRGWYGPREVCFYAPISVTVFSFSLTLTWRSAPRKTSAGRRMARSLGPLRFLRRRLLAYNFYESRKATAPVFRSVIAQKWPPASLTLWQGKGVTAGCMTSLSSEAFFSRAAITTSSFFFFFFRNNSGIDMRVIFHVLTHRTN